MRARPSPSLQTPTTPLQDRGAIASTEVSTKVPTDALTKVPPDAWTRTSSVLSTAASLLVSQRRRNRAIRAHAVECASAHTRAQAEGAIDSLASADADTPLGIVPLQERALTRLPAPTRARFLTRLAGRLDEAFMAPSVVPAQESDEDTRSTSTESILARGCAMCRGACCTRGSDHAFLGADSLARVRCVHPAHNAESLLATYSVHLPTEHFADSCVYHAESGCALPRALRSNTCNRYRCGGLTELRRALESSGHPLAFIGASDNESLRAFALAAASELRPIDLTAAHDP